MMNPTNNSQLVDAIVDICNEVLFNNGNDYQYLVLPELSLADWKEFFNLASIHGTLPIIMPVFESRQFDDEQLKEVVVDSYVVAQKYREKYRIRIQAMQELAGMFAEKGLDVMFFKGAALAQLYPNPEWRVFSDIDFYLYGKWKEGIVVMEEHGIANRPFWHHNTEADLYGILLENHYDFIERVNHKHHIILDDELKDLANSEGHNYKASFLPATNKNVYVMAPTMNAIFLLRHMGAHFASETISIRMLYDWALFLKKHTKDVDWVRVLGLYEQSRLSMFARMIQGILVSKMGIAIPNCPVEPLLGENTDLIWNSIIEGETPNPYKKNGLLYTLNEVRVFMRNRWKHQLVFPQESYTKLFFSYVFLHLRSIIQRWFHKA